VQFSIGLGSKLVDKKKILFFVNNLYFFVSHRLHIARRAKASGFEVHIAASPEKDTTYTSHLQTQGFVVHAVNMKKSRFSILSEFLTFVSFLILAIRLRPDICHLVTIRPILFGGLASLLSGVQTVILAVSGMGHVFLSTGFKANLRKLLVTIVLRFILLFKRSTLIVQNQDDLQFFLKLGVNKKKIHLIRGSGVDPEQFKPSVEPEESVSILFASRLLKEKGIEEWIQAARKIKSKNNKVRFVLAGDFDPGNPSSIEEDQVHKWVEEGVVEYQGYQKDMATTIAKSNVVCLPSYREGLPKVLLEAQSVGRAVVTTDVPGCRELVKHGKNGLLVQHKNSEELAAAINYLIENPKQRKDMASVGRAIVESSFTEEEIAKQTINLYRSSKK
jgi:glycosyltransferase involved in cell wall biosynthesis